MLTLQPLLLVSRSLRRPQLAVTHGQRLTMAVRVAAVMVGTATPAAMGRAQVGNVLVVAWLHVCM